MTWFADATDNNQVCQMYGDKWRRHRRTDGFGTLRISTIVVKILLIRDKQHTAVGTQAVRSHRKFQSEETALLIRDLLTAPEDFVMWIERLVLFP